MKSPNTLMIEKTTIFTKMDKMVLILMLSERNVLRRGSCWERRSKVQIRTSCWVGSPASKLCIAHTTSLMMLGQVEHCIIYTALYRTLHILYVLAPNDKLCRFQNNTVTLLFNSSSQLKTSRAALTMLLKMWTSLDSEMRWRGKASTAKSRTGREYIYLKV